MDTTTTAAAFKAHPSTHAWALTSAAYVASSPFGTTIPIDGTCASILIFWPAPTSPAVTREAGTAPPPRLLIVRRALTDSMPGCWEVPGGGTDPDDETLLHGAAREVAEETGLVVDEFLAVVPLVHVDPDDAGSAADDSRARGETRPDSWFYNRSRTKRFVKVCLVASVHPDPAHRGDDGDAVPLPPTVMMDAAEHMDALWATEDEVRNRTRADDGEPLEFTPNWPALVEGFRVWREIAARGRE
jgi:8-oxo-dGTP pyrophosphatase MutT (NUDIX family)